LRYKCKYGESQFTDSGPWIGNFIFRVNEWRIQPTASRQAFSRKFNSVFRFSIDWSNSSSNLLEEGENYVNMSRREREKSGCPGMC
jgi:hypothetical protein